MTKSKGILHRNEPMPERILRMSVMGASGCWQWIKYIDPRGYGQMLVNGKKREAHRVAYETFRGEVPRGLVLDHLCRNRACVNAAHLEPVTHRENILRGVGATAQHARQSHCRYGHPFIETHECGRKRRRCRTCQNAAVARYQARKHGSMSGIVAKELTP